MAIHMQEASVAKAHWIAVSQHAAPRNDIWGHMPRRKIGYLLAVTVLQNVA